MSGSQVRGRRPAGSGTKLAIEEAARRRFAEIGYPRTTMRAIAADAADAGVDSRLTHFFGLTFARHVVGFPVLLAADRRSLAAVLGDVFTVCLQGHLSSVPD
jgi:Bacterial regulatory proteins, tetR family